MKQLNCKMTSGIYMNVLCDYVNMKCTCKDYSEHLTNSPWYCTEEWG